jgi:HEPN domain-containing protein
MNDTVKEWLDRAEGDFRSASREMKAEDEYSYPVVCVLFQQCVEKTFKAYLILKQIDFPKIHDLEKLSTHVCEVDSRINLEGVALDWLTSIAGTARYPEGFIDKNDTQKAFEIASRIRTELLPYFEGP